MQELKRSTQQFLRAAQTSDADTRFDRLLVPILVAIGIGYTAFQLLQRDFVEAVLFGASVLLVIVIAGSRTVQMAVLGKSFNRRHAIHVILIWGELIVLMNLLRLLANASPFDKDAAYFTALLIVVIGVAIMLVRSVLIMTRRGYRFFSVQIPIWEQILLTINESMAILLVSAFMARHLTRLTMPEVFTIRADPLYVIVVGIGVLMYYFGMQLMWVGRMNEWLSHNTVWVRLARLLAPFGLLAITLLISTRLVERSDTRTAALLGASDSTLPVLAIAPVIWLIVLVVMILVYSSRRGLRQRFFPDALFEWLPPRLSGIFRTISDIDILLIVAALSTAIPVYLLLVAGDSSAIVSFLRTQVLQNLGAFVETNEQVLALLFAMPFYVLIVGMMIVYGYVLSRPGLTAPERGELVERLPIGFLIILIITLYLFAVPFSQFFTEGRLPRIPQDLGRILAFNVVIPLAMLYLHYFLLVRLPYGRGQRRWRENEAERLNIQLHAVDRRLDDINRQLQQLEQTWNDVRSGQSNLNLTQNFDTLYRYVRLNSMRDDINIQRLSVISDRQQLAEISEAPVSLAVARLPIRVVSIGIPLLIAIQIYQWAVVNNGLQQIIENPNLTVFDFFRVILEQAQF